MRRLIITALAASLCAGSITTGAAMAGTADEARLERLDREVQRLEDVRAIRTLQRAYGYYTDRALWHEVADLFAPDATMELGADGVYVGKERILQYLRHLGGGRDGLAYGQLNEHLQLQPVVDIDPDGVHAKARWRDLGMLGQYQKSAAWSDGVYENTYVKRNGVWMIQSAHLYVTFVAPYDSGWARLKPSGDWRSQASRDFPPDRPSTGHYKLFPDVSIAPFHYRNPAEGRPRSRQARTTGKPSPSASLLEQYESQAERLRDHDEIENLQGIYGYYFDKSLWDEVAKLFSKNGTFEYGQRGVYVGRQHIARALRLFGPEGPRQGQLNNYMQLQPVITVAADGRSAKARWRSIVQLSRPNQSGQWGEGTYENEYVLEDGIWKISRLHFYVTAFADYDLMWNKGPIPMQGPSAVLPPDRPPTEIYRSLPGVYLPPFHYVHPVTGKPIDPREPADSVLGRK